MADGTQLYLVFTLDDGDRLRKAVPAVLGAAPVATILLQPARGGPIDASLAKQLIEIAQKAGTAVLLADDASLARALKADGVHLSWSKEPMKRYRETREMLGERFIVGADAGRSRHDAMELGEAGADYIAFGVPPHVEDIATARERQADLVGWWSEIFEIPCVAFDVSGIEDARALTRAGADFAALRVPSDPETAAEAVKALVSEFAKEMS